MSDNNNWPSFPGEYPDDAKERSPQEKNDSNSSAMPPIEFPPSGEPVQFPGEFPSAPPSPPAAPATGPWASQTPNDWAAADRPPTPQQTQDPWAVPPGQAPVPPPGWQQFPAQQNSGGNGLAIVALISGFCCGLVAIPLGIIAFFQARKKGGSIGLAVAAIIIGFMNLLAIVGMGFFVGYSLEVAEEACHATNPTPEEVELCESWKDLDKALSGESTDER